MTATPAVPSRPKLKRVRRRGTWERGYRCHVYWLGKRRLGVVRLGPYGEWDGAYRWECPELNLRGQEGRLEAAKVIVETAVHLGAYQYDLFDSLEPVPIADAAQPSPAIA